MDGLLFVAPVCGKSANDAGLLGQMRARRTFVSRFAANMIDYRRTNGAERDRSQSGQRGSPPSLRRLTMLKVSSFEASTPAKAEAESLRCNGLVRAARVERDRGKAVEETTGR